jgi:hypothetical protein
MTLLTLLIYFLVLLLVFGLIWWVLTQIPLPPPIGKMAQVVVVVIFALILIFLLLSVIGVGPNVQLR